MAVQHTLSDISGAMAEVYDTTPVMVEARQGITSKFIKRVTPFESNGMHRKFMDEMFSRVIASSNLEATLPTAGQIKGMDMEITTSHLRQLGFSVDGSMAAMAVQKNDDVAMGKLATMLVFQAEAALSQKRNSMIHMNGDLVMGQVAAIYDEDGTTYTSGQTDAFLQIDEGSISRFSRGMILDIREASDNSDVQVTVEVDSVWHDLDYRGETVGPGIIVSTSSENSGDADLDNIADGDEIVQVGETTGNYPGAWQTLIDLSSSPASYFGLDRTTVTNAFLIPYGADYGSGSTPTELNLDVHFGKMANLFGKILPKSRQNRRGRMFDLTEALVCVGQDDLINEVASQAGLGSMFTVDYNATAKEAKSMPLTAVHGWEGAVLRHPNLPPIVFKAEPLAKANTLTIFDPNAFEFIRLGYQGVPGAKGGGAQSMRPTWVSNDSGGIWHTIKDTSGSETLLTPKKQAGGFVHETLFCDQPQLVYQIQGVTHSLDS